MKALGHTDPDIGASEPTPQPIAYSPKSLAALILVGPSETLSERTVRDWCASGAIKARKMGSRWIIPAASVEELLNGPLPDGILPFRPPSK